MATEADEEPEAPRIRVTLLTRPQCGFCEDAKAILTRLAREYPLVIETMELDSSEGERLALEGGVLLPPGIFLDGEPFSYGRPSERKLRRAVAQRSAGAHASATVR
jgi:glutaredoxin